MCIRRMVCALIGITAAGLSQAQDIVNVIGNNGTTSTLVSGSTTVPADVYWVDIQVFSGAGGGGGADSGGLGGSGGSGGLITGTIAVTPGDTISYAVGNGGTGGQSLQYLNSSGTGGGHPGTGGVGAAGGGNGGTNASTNPTGSGGGGGGGGASLLKIGTTFVLAGGGGGGGGGSYNRAARAGVSANSLALVESSSCGTPAPGLVPAAWTLDGGTGGGGGAGYLGAVGAAGTAGRDSLLAATGGGAGGACFYAPGVNLINGSLTFAVGPTGGTSINAANVYVNSGNAGRIIVTPNTTLPKPITSTITATPIPTVSEWALMLLSGSLAGFAMLGLRRARMN